MSGTCYLKSSYILKPIWLKGTMIRRSAQYTLFREYFYTLFIFFPANHEKPASTYSSVTRFFSMYNNQMKKIRYRPKIIPSCLEVQNRGIWRKRPQLCLYPASDHAHHLKIYCHQELQGAEALFDSHLVDEPIEFQGAMPWQVGWRWPQTWCCIHW